MTIRALVMTAPGINCDLELAHSLRGGRRHRRLPSADAIDPASRSDRWIRPDRSSRWIQLRRRHRCGTCPCDDVAHPPVSGTAGRDRTWMSDDRTLQRVSGRRSGGIVAGSCRGSCLAETSAPPEVSLAQNAQAMFRDTWTPMEASENTRCIWTRGIDFSGETGMLPSAHGEGRFVAGDDVVIRLQENGQVALRYAEDSNFKRFPPIASPVSVMPADWCSV